MRIAVIADTHNRLPASLSEKLAEADEILHLGDMCDFGVFESLKAIGPPVTLVRGNNDLFPEWPISVDIKRADYRLRLIHIPPRKHPDDVDLLLHGHTHFPRDETIAGVRYLNPGCIHRANKGAPPSYAWLEFKKGAPPAWRIVLLRE